MSAVLPSDERMFFILCEDVRVEIDNKLTLVGVFAGGNILLLNKNFPVVISSLIIYVCFTDGSGDVEGKLVLYDPSGKEVVHTNPAMMHKREGDNMVMTVKLSPFTIQMEGRYKVVAFVDGRTYERSFLIRVAETD